MVHIPFDPWNQSIKFQNTCNTGTNAEIAYRFFASECKPMEAIIMKPANNPLINVIRMHIEDPALRMNLDFYREKHPDLYRMALIPENSVSADCPQLSPITPD